MEGTETRLAVGLAVGVLALLGLRAVVAALEAALVAIGTPRAQALAAAPDAGRRARSLGALVADRERTSLALRVAGSWSTLFAGLLAGWAGAMGAPDGAAWAGGAIVALVAAALSIPIAAAGRGLGARHGEPVALALAPAFLALRTVVSPLGRPARWLAGKRGRFSLPLPPLDEMERVLAEVAKRQGVSDATSELIHRVFEFREKVARDVMVPRTDVVAVEIDTPVPEIVRILAEEGHSRMPVFRESLDQIAGVLHARDLVPLLAHPELIVLRDLLRPAHFVPWSKPVDQLLRELQRRKLHMAFVVDEYGGVMGICTIEDVLEEIVGEIHDEFEEDEGKAVEAHADGSFTALGTTSVAELNEATQAGVPDDQGYETVAGFLNAIAGAIPSRGDRFFWRGWVFTIVDADPRRVTKVRAARVKRTA